LKFGVKHANSGVPVEKMLPPITRTTFTNIMHKIADKKYADLFSEYKRKRSWVVDLFLIPFTISL
jgi:hypothetical protein